MSLWDHRAPVWHEVAPPLRPSAAELAFLQQWLDRWFGELPAATDVVHVLVLGATAEYFSLRWPANVTLTAVDLSPAMLQLWPGPPSSRVCRDWLTLTPEFGRFDLVLGDGSLCQLGWPVQQRALAGVLRNLLRPGGLLLTRAFVQADQHETLQHAVADLQRAAPSSPSLVKLRLWLACQQQPATGVSLCEAWQQLLALLPDAAALAHLLGVSLERAHAISEHYLHHDGRCLHFSTTGRLLQLFCDNDGGFALESLWHPAGEMGEYCPTMVLRRTHAHGLPPR